VDVPLPVTRFVARHRRAAWNRAVAKACRTYLNAFDNLDYDGQTNGEHALVERLSCPAGAVAFDVGANAGSWTATFRARHPGARIHAFEIDADVAASLEARFARDAAITVVPVGLSDRSGPSEARRSTRSSRVTSIVASAALNPDADAVPVELESGDDYLARAGIDHVRVVKVDTEGHDLNVLRGFAGALGAGHIDVVQFEHNEWAVPAGVHLADFYDLLEPLGYDIGRLFPDFVQFRSWRPAYEREAAGNHVAVRRSQVALRAQAAGAAA
jgi:FkbM family methyltransferase